MEELLRSEGIPFRFGFLDFPNWTRRVKIDVGLSVNAPHSQVWLEAQKDLFVIGFEPVRRNIDNILRGDSPWPINLDPLKVGQRMWIIPCALGNSSGQEVKMYITANDPGCSSILLPRTFEVQESITTQMWRLSDLLAYFPWERLSLIEHLKIDVQGMDYEVLLGTKEYLNRILFITVEVDTLEYLNTTNSLYSISSLLKEHGFIRIPKNRILKRIWQILNPNFVVSVKDPTFFNYRLWRRSRYHDAYIYQET